MTPKLLMKNNCEKATNSLDMLEKAVIVTQPYENDVHFHLPCKSLPSELRKKAF